MLDLNQRQSGAAKEGGVTGVQEERAFSLQHNP